jgi:methylglyoxal synthase
LEHLLFSDPLNKPSSPNQVFAIAAVDQLAACSPNCRDPLTSQPHEPDVSALLRLCDIHNIPLATNLNSAEILIEQNKNLQNRKASCLVTE